MTTLWDNIKKGFADSAKLAKEGASIAAEKAEELGKKSKIMLDISNVKRKIEKQFTELGGKVYHAVQVEKSTDFASNDEINAIVDSIKSLEDELHEKQEELNRVGKMKEDAAEEPVQEAAEEKTPEEETKTE